MTAESHSDALSFAQLLKKTRLPEHLRMGKFLLPATKGVTERIQYNQGGTDLLENTHEYSIPLLEGLLQVSMQLYENSAHYYRLFCYTRMGNTQGMVFSLNLTMQKESGSKIHLAQKIKFIEPHPGNPLLAQNHRRQKQLVFSQQLRKLGYNVSENNDLSLGFYDPIREKLIDTTARDLLNDFLVISILKGHYQGNKGYQLEIIPSFEQMGNLLADSDGELEHRPS